MSEEQLSEQVCENCGDIVPDPPFCISFKKVYIFFAVLFFICFLFLVITGKVDIGSSLHEHHSMCQASPGSSANNCVASAASEPIALSLNFDKGNYVMFGRYPQNSGKTPEPIEWLVLDNDGSNALLLSKYGLDCQPFHNDYKDIKWNLCDLRKWLNSDFLETAFSDTEKQRIADDTIYTNDNPVWGTKGCGPSRDKVFCLSVDEVNKYFPLQDGRKCLPTSYAVSHHVWSNDEGYCWFWLRSPGRSADRAASVDCGGAIYNSSDIDSGDFAVRPVIRIIM